MVTGIPYSMDVHRPQGLARPFQRYVSASGGTEGATRIVPRSLLLSHIKCYVKEGSSSLSRKNISLLIQGVHNDISQPQPHPTRIRSKRAFYDVQRKLKVPDIPAKKQHTPCDTERIHHPNQCKTPTPATYDSGCPRDTAKTCYAFSQSCWISYLPSSIVRSDIPVFLITPKYVNRSQISSFTNIRALSNGKPSSSRRLLH